MNNKSMRPTIILPLLLSLIFSCTHAAQEQQPADYPNSGLLVQAPELYEILSNENIFLIDARAEAADSAIPGSVHFAAVSELIDRDHPVDFYLIGPETFMEKMQTIGLNNHDRVIIYDDGNSLAAARLFYALDYYGFSQAAILNGGFQGWLDHDLPVESGYLTKERSSFKADIQESKFCDIQYVMAAADNPDKIIFDARSAGEYSGEDVRAQKSGHIPNAVNLEWNNVLQPEGTPYFLPAAEIQEKFTALGITPDKEVISHCHTNVRGSHAYFTLRLMGYDSVRTYEGSWAEYGNHPESVTQ